LFVPFIPKQNGMKQKLLFFCAAAILITACNNEKKADGDKKETAAAETKTTTAETKAIDPKDTAAMMKAWMDFATPGDMHKWMAKAAGKWEGEMTQWMDPAAPPTKSTAKSDTKVAMNGLYLLDDYSGDMMGQPFMGHSIMGYDNVKKMFVSSWIDNMGSGIVRMEGTYDAATKTLHMKGKQSDPASGGETDIRQEQKWLDDDTYILSMYGTGHDGKTEQKFMEGTFKRKK